MSASFTISQRIYIEQAGCSVDLLSKLRALQCTAVVHKDGSKDMVAILSDPAETTIEQQFRLFHDHINELVNVLKQNEYSGASLLQVYVKAYKYIPEISMPGGLVHILAKVSCAIDVDVIDMITADL